jgi:hypothetical protein
MKKLFYLTAVCLAVASVGGCNRSWPSCFSCQDQVYPAADCCEPCDPCTQSYYMPGASDVQWLPESAPTHIDSLPTPGPDTSST